MTFSFVANSAFPRLAIYGLFSFLKKNFLFLNDCISLAVTFHLNACACIDVFKGKLKQMKMSCAPTKAKFIAEYGCFPCSFVNSLRSQC